MNFTNQIKNIVSITQQDYQNLYLNIFDSIDKSLKENNIQFNFESVINKIIATLKIRRAYMLPMGSDTETCYQQHDAWTYALFTAVLFKNIAAEINEQKPLEIAKQFIPETGLNWLKKYEVIWNEWQSYLERNIEDNKPNTFELLINITNEALQGKKNYIQ